MSKLKVGDIVIAPEGCKPWLTPGKEYEVKKDINGFSDEMINIFCIKSDNGNDLYCKIYNCAHLNGKDWIIKEKSNN